MDRLKREPAVVIGIVAAVILAVVQSLNGSGVLGSDAADTISKALDPTTGWAIPIVLGIVTRFFVSPASKAGL
jgi:hypothetical protein